MVVSGVHWAGQLSEASMNRDAVSAAWNWRGFSGTKFEGRDRIRRGVARWSVETLEARTLLTAALDVNATSHVLTYVAQTGFSNSITVELTSAATPTLRISEGNGENISMGTAAQTAGWHYPDISNVHVVEGPAASVSLMTFDTKDGSDQVFLLSAGVPVTVSPSAGATLAVEVGSANGEPGLSQNVAGPVVIANSGGTSSVFVNDFAEAVARMVSVTDTGISGLTPNA